MAEQQKSIWKTLERNTDGETKILTVHSGSVKHNILVFTSPIGACTSIVITGNVEFPESVIEKTNVGSWEPEKILDFAPNSGSEKSKK
jgi:hypothetical protein